MIAAKELDVRAIRKEYERTHTGTANRTACTLSGDYKVDVTDAEAEFGLAINRYKRENRRPFPTFGEVLAVLVALGYRKEI